MDDIQYQDEMDNRAEYAEGEWLSRNGQKYCPDCAQPIDDDNELIEERHNPDAFGCCESCYDPTPAGPEYSAGFELNH